MTRKFPPTCKRVLATIQSSSILFLFLILSGLVNHLSAAAMQAPVRGPKIWLGDNQALPVKPVGAPTLAQSVAAGQAQPTAMATADVDGDGIADMVAGFSVPGGGAIVIHRGNVDAFAPQTDVSFQAIGRGQFPAPFLPNAQVFNVPVRPDFIALGRFTPSGHQDLVVAALGGNSLFVFSGDGKGGFGAPQTVPLSGSVTAMASENLLRSLPYSNLVVGTATPQTSSLLVFSGTDSGLSPPAAFPLAAAASNIVFGDFGDSHTDTAFLSGGNVFILHSSNFQMEALSLPVNASAMALGSFIFDRVPALQIALLTSDGSLHIAVHTEFDPRPLTTDEIQARLHAGRRGFGNPLDPPRMLPQNGFKIVESIASAAPFASGQPPVLFRTRISDHGADDVMVLNPSMGQLAVIAHPDVAAGATTFLPAVVSTRPYSGSPVAALPMRTNIDNRPGVVALHAGQLAPAVMMPLPDPTFFVNRTDDPTPGTVAATCNNVSNVDTSSSCSVREAILKANATAGTDTISIAAGTYTLSLARINGVYDGKQGTLEVLDSVNIVGAGQATTIIRAGTTNTNGVDMLMAVNEDISPTSNASASITNLTLQFGRNRGSVAGGDGDGGCMEFDTGTSGTATLNLTNITLTDCSTTDGNGGGIAIFNFIVNGPGQPTLTNSIIQNNSVAEIASGGAGSGGGMFVAFPARVSMTNTQVINNNASQVNGTGRGTGGGMLIFGNAGSRQTVIHGGTISGNSASGDGGGINDSANLLIDNSGGPTVISGNHAGVGAPEVHVGGGLYLNPGLCSPQPCTNDSVTLTKVTITGNTATGNGGGIAVGNDTGAGPVTIQFSRIAGNTGTAGSHNLDNDHTTITATNNWWGTNAPAGTITNRNSGVTTFDPFIQLTHVASPSTIRINQSTTLTGDMSRDNHGNGAALAGNLDVIVGLPITFNNPVLGTIPQAQPETLNASAQATATFNAGGTSGHGSADATVDQATVTAPIIILEPLQITKSFSPNPVAVNASSTLTFSVNNPNVIAVDASLTDTLPAGLVVAATPGVTNSCGGTVTAIAGSGSISFSNASLPVGACSITVNVSSAIDNIYSNSVTINSTAAGTGAQSTSSANLTVIDPPTISKIFGDPTIPLNGTTSLTFHLSSSNTNLTLNGVAFTDNLPAGLVVATPGNLNSTCSGTATAVDGSSSISLSGASVAPGANCTISVNVTGTTAGVKSNSVAATSTNGGTSGTNTALLTVVAPPTLTKSFSAASIPLNGSATLSFTITNPNSVGLANINFSDTLPPQLLADGNKNLGTCTATINSTAGTSLVTFAGGSLSANSSCTFSVGVTGVAPGTANNTTGNISSANGGTGGTASASMNVEAPPSIAKVFNPSTIGLNGTTSLTFTITNPAANVDPLTGVAFTDTLPTGLTVANASATVCGGTLTTTAPTGIALTGATIAVNSQCQFSVTVTGAASGSYTNTTGSVTSTNGGTGNTASANLTVATPPAITKAFGAASIPLNGTTSLSFNITNPNTNVTLNGIAFTDNLPAGLVVATPSALSSTCGGTATAAAGSGSISLSGGTLAASASCTLSVNVTGTTAGVKNNSVQVTSTEGGTGNTSNASITVVAPPVIIKAFGAASIPLNGSTSLTFTIQNNNTTTTLTGVGFTDTLPAGLVISTPNGLTGTCGGGTITATQATNVISLTGASLAASSSCAFSVNVTGIAAGTQNNTTGNVTSTEGGTGGTASASINVVAPPSIAKAFGAAAIPLNGTTSLTFTITNPAANAVAETGVAFTDTLPVGIVVATPNGLTNTCGGTATAVAGSGSISLTGGTIAASSSCTLTVNITATAAGSFTNTTGNVSSTNGGTGNTATATLSVATPPTITKAFGAAVIPLNGTTSLTFTVTNPNTGTQLNGVAFTDSLPAGLVVANPNGLTGTPSCVAATTAVAGSSTISLAGLAMGPSSSCTVSVNITGTTPGVKNNSVQVTATESGPGNTSNASITVLGPPVIIKAFGAASIPLNGTTSLTFTIQNNNTTSSLTGVGFGDTLPAGLNVATPNGLTGSCGGGTITATAGTNVISLTGASLTASSSCTFSVNVTGIAAGQQNNTTGNVTSTEGGTGGTASASIAVVAPPSIAKAFNPTAIAVNGVSTLTFTITNPAANTVAETGVAFSDTLPAGLVVATPNGLTNTCAGTATATAGSGSVSLTGGTVATASSCTLSVDVTGSAVGTYNNTSGAVSSTNGGTGNTASASLTIAVADLTITKTHTGTFTRGQNGANWIITVKNSGVGPTIGAVNVVDTLPNVTNPPVPTAISGTGWTCTLATLTCTRSDALAPGASYPPITLTVNIPINIQNNFTNTATVSGGGETNTGNNTATDTISLGPPIIIKPHSTTASVVAGGSAVFTFDVEDQDPSLGMVTFGCSGLPVGTACSFSPAATNQPLTTVTMTVTTSNGKALAATARNSGPGGRSPLYAALFFPVFGMVGIALSGRRGRKARLRFALVVIGALALLSFAGCAGGLHGIVTPAGNYQLTVTASSATVQASTPVTLGVQ